MSGVFGLAASSLSARGCRESLTRMGAAMAHRPWFVVDRHEDETSGVWLGRIGIGIFNPERQPVLSEDGSIALMLSGEFYDTERARQQLGHQVGALRDESDAELALRLYQVRGARFVEELEGVFVLCLWDRPGRVLIVANDRVGLYPLYYAHLDGTLVFAPEVKGILCHSAFRAKLDWAALAEYMRFQYLLGDKTFFEGIRLLPNATILTFNLADDSLALRSYWDMSQITMLPHITFEEAVEEAGRLLRNATEKRTVGRHRLGVYLSGGMDSRTILGLLDRRLFPVDTVTYGLPDSRDVHYARQLAARARTRHHDFPFTDGRWVLDHVGLHLELTEGFHSWIHAHGIAILDDVRRLFDVNLSGVAGGELTFEDLALYEAPDRAAFLVSAFRALSQEATWPSLDDTEERLLYSPSLTPDLRGLAFESLRSEIRKLEHLPRSLLVATLSRFTSDRRLFQYQVAFSRAFIELRFPFADYRYLEFIHGIPPQMVFHRRLRAALIRHRLPDLAAVPYDRDCLPISAGEAWRAGLKLFQRARSLVNRRVHPMFVELKPVHSDYEGWLRTDLKDWAEDILLGERTIARGIFSADFLRSIWSRHQSGLEKHTVGKIAPIMTYEMMLRRYFDG